MNRDLITGLLLLAIAMLIFLIHVCTGPRHGTYPTAPPYVRRGVMLWGGILLWRAVDLLQLAHAPAAGLGHVNATAMMATFALFYLVAAISWWVGTSRLPHQTWDRLSDAFRRVRRAPELVPVVLTPPDVAEVARAEGFPTTEASEGPAAVVRELEARR